MLIPFNKPAVTGKEEKYLKEVLSNHKISGDGKFNKKCSQWFEKNFNCKKVLLTSSGTHALEMAALVTDIKPGDEVILPSYTFTSTANAFALRGAKLVFVDIRPDTMNIDENLIENAITNHTKAIIPVHYAGVSCNMNTIIKIANKYHLKVIEDAAQGVYATFQNQYLGTLGNIGCYSFHETKNYSCGEGGAIVINDEELIEKAEIIREKGTNRERFFRGQVDKYTWVDLGSSYLSSELNAAYLFAQLETAETINKDRLNSWNHYYKSLLHLQKSKLIQLPTIPDNCKHNAHMFYIKVNDTNNRNALIEYLNSNNIYAVFHYIPLHTSPAGKRFGRFYGIDKYTTNESNKLIRLPMYYGLEKEQIDKIVKCINNYFS